MTPAPAGTAAPEPRASAPQPPGRQQRRATSAAFRPRRALPAIVAAAVLAAAAVLTTIEVAAGLLDRRVSVLPVGWLTRLGHDTRFDDPLAITASAAVCLVGVAALTLAVAPGRPRVIALTSADPQTVIGITRAGLRRQLTAAATGVDGIARVRIRIGRRRVRIKATSPLRDTSGLPAQVVGTVTGRLHELAPLRPLRVRATVRSRPD